MSEPEFELYLSLMSRFLRLNGAQKSDIAEELRIHLEERLAELTAQGMSREDAIRLALDEFGDAGALAWQFTLPHHSRRRRLIMRYSIGSFVALAGIFTLVSFTWPTRPDSPPAQSLVSAQAKSDADPDRQPTIVTHLAASDNPEITIRHDIETKLASREFEFDFGDTPIEEVLTFLSELIEVDIIADDLSAYAGTTVKLRARKGSLSVKSAIELILKQTSGDELGYSIKDGVILISNNQVEFEVQVYDCRDVLAGVFVNAAGGFGGGGGGFSGGGGGGFFSVAAELSPVMFAQFGAGGGGAGAGGVAAAPTQQATAAPENFTSTSATGAALIRTLQAATSPGPWESVHGEGGTMSEFGGMIIVRHHQSMHRKIEDVLGKIRKAKLAQQTHAAEEPLDIPAGMRLVTLLTGTWQVPANALKPGRRVDIAEVKNGEAEVIFENLEIKAYAISAQQTSQDFVFVQSVGFVVPLELALKIKDVDERASHTSNNRGSLQFLLRGEEAAAEPALRKKESDVSP